MRALQLTALLTAAGFASGSAQPRAVETPPVATDTVWYITNRAQRDDLWVNQRAGLSYGLRTFQVLPIRREESSFEVRLAVTPLGAASLDVTEFLTSLKRSLHQTGPNGALLLHVHGYATSMTEAGEDAAEMRRRGGFRGPMLIFSWPANNRGMKWPGSGRLLTKAYWQDSTTATASAPDLARAIEMLVGEIGADRMVVSGHSMGNLALAAALNDEVLSRQLRDTPLRAVAFVSPDVDREYFRDSVVPRAHATADRVILYGARDDVMLKLSGTIHGGRPRAGLLDGSLRWPAALDVVDFTDGRAAAFWLGPWIDTRHALRREGSALVDLFSIVESNSPTECRTSLGAISVPTGNDSTAAPQWRLTDAPLPPRDGLLGGEASRPCTGAVSAP